MADGRSIAEELGVLVKETQSALHHRMDSVLRALDLTVSQYACLQALSDTPGITGSELARRAFVSRQSMNVLLQGLAKRGLIERSDDLGPRRERATELTAAAREVLDQARSAVADTADVMVAPLDAGERAQLRSLLIACRDALRGV